MYKENLSWKMLTETLSYLTERRLVKYNQDGARRTISLTELGASCVQRLHEARSYLVPEEPQTDGFSDFEPQRVFPTLSAATPSTHPTGLKAW